MSPSFSLSELLAIHADENAAHVSGARREAEKLYQSGLKYLEAFVAFVPRSQMEAQHAMDLARHLTTTPNMPADAASTVRSLVIGAHRELHQYGPSLMFVVATQMALNACPDDDALIGDPMVNQVLENVLTWAEMQMAMAA